MNDIFERTLLVTSPNMNNKLVQFPRKWNLFYPNMKEYRVSYLCIFWQRRMTGRIGKLISSIFINGQMSFWFKADVRYMDWTETSIFFWNLGNACKIHCIVAVLEFRRTVPLHVLRKRQMKLFNINVYLYVCSGYDGMVYLGRPSPGPFQVFISNYSPCA